LFFHIQSIKNKDDLKTIWQKKKKI